jgi:hypothetical protein
MSAVSLASIGRARIAACARARASTRSSTVIVFVRARIAETFPTRDAIRALPLLIRAVTLSIYCRYVL